MVPLAAESPAEPEGFTVEMFTLDEVAGRYVPARTVELDELLGEG